ncbi:MAG: IncP-type conjugal transfer protein TraG [Halothiobacillaceae bacterium]
MAKNSSSPTELYNLSDKPTEPGGLQLLGAGAGLLMLLTVTVITTQYLAAALDYQAALGAPVIGKIYAPWMFAIWLWEYGNVPALKSIVFVAYVMLIGGAAVAVVGAALISYWYRRKFGNVGMDSLHGSAHWASEDEIKEMGVFDSAGVFIGAWKNPRGDIQYLRHDGPEHIMAFAPTRSGKGVGLVLPTLLAWRHSALVYDIKGENYALTAGWRKTEANNRIIRFSPTDITGSASYNPLNEVRLGTQREIADIQNLVTMIVDPDGKGMTDHWAKTGHALLVGTVLHVMYSESDKTLRGVAMFLSDPSRTLEETLAQMMNTSHIKTPDGTEHPHPVVAASARDMMNKSENERSGVLSTAMSFLTLYRDPIVASNTDKSDFAVSDLMNAEQPVSLYLVVPPSDKDRLKPLIRLIINQIIRNLTESMEFKDGRSVAGYKHRLLLMIDEFPSLGRLDIFQEALAFIAGYGMKAYLITQDLSQLYAAYGKDESIMSNCHIRIAYAPNKIETAELLSKMSGTTTIIKRQESFSGGRTKLMLEQISTSIQEVQRPLLTPDEALRLPGPQKDGQGNIIEAGDMLIFVAGKAPIYGKQILYFKDPLFLARAKCAAPQANQSAATAISTSTPPEANTDKAAPQPGQAYVPPLANEQAQAARQFAPLAQTPRQSETQAETSEKTDEATAASTPSDNDTHETDMAHGEDISEAGYAVIADSDELAPPDWDSGAPDAEQYGTENIVIGHAEEPPRVKPKPDDLLNEFKSISENANLDTEELAWLAPSSMPDVSALRETDVTDEGADAVFDIFTPR